MGFIAMLNLILILIAPEIVSIFAPHSYYEAIWTIPPICMSVYFIFVYDFFAKFEFYYETKLFIMVASIIAAILNVSLNLIFIPKYGYIAAGYTTLLCYIAYVLGHYFFMNRVVKRNIGDVIIYNPYKLLVISIGFLLIGFLFSLTYYNVIIRYTLVIIISIVALIFRKRIIHFANKLRTRV